MNYSISFPNIGITLSHVPKTFNVFGLDIAVYGCTMALGILAGLYLAMFLAKKTRQNPDDYLNIALIGIVLGLSCARAYYVIFTWDYYRLHPLEILNLRGGGLALYGSLIGAVLAVVLYCRKKKLKIMLVLDTASCGMVIGQIIGRWGNFFNREAFGGYTDNLLAMQLPLSAVRADEVTKAMLDHQIVQDGVTFIRVHPTFLYESLWNCGVLLILLAVTLRSLKAFDGEVFLWYLCLYGAGRFWVEGLRTDQLHLWGTQVAVSQVLGAVMAVGCFVLIWVIRGKKRRTAG